MIGPPVNVGALVLGSPHAARALVRHAELLTAYADGDIANRGDTREAYLSQFAFGPEMQTHFAGNRNSVAGYAGTCWCRWLVLDIDRADLTEALTDARRLVCYLGERYPEAADDVPVYFSGGKGFHVLVELAHCPAPAVGFHRVARAFAELIATGAGVRIDTAIYDANHIVRLPNTRHARTGLFKRRIDADALLRIDLAGIREHAKQPAGDGLPSLRHCPAKLADDWSAAEFAAQSATSARDARRVATAGVADTRAPRYLLEFIRFGVREGERHSTLFRCAAWLTEQRAPVALVFAMLTEAGRDVGLSPIDVDRQIQCGIEHAARQRGTAAEPAEADRGDAWEHPRDRLGIVDPAALEFPFGANIDGPYGGAGGRR